MLPLGALHGHEPEAPIGQTVFEIIQHCSIPRMVLHVRWHGVRVNECCKFCVMQLRQRVPSIVFRPDFYPP